MAVTSRQIYSNRLYMGISVIRRNLTLPIGLVTLVLAIGAVYLLVSTLIDLGQNLVNDMRYGRPRTTQISGFVGHEEGNGQQSHFIGLNLDRQVVVLELPGSDANKVRVLPGPYLFGAREDLTPVDLALQDMDGDRNVDLLITVRNEQVVYLNKDGTFRLPSAAEQQRLLQQRE